jgi:hypothetical protein
MHNKYLRAIIMAFLGTWFAYKLYKSADGDFVFDFIVFFFIGGLGVGFYIWTTLKDNKECILIRNLTSYLPTFTGVDFLGIIFSTNYYQDKRRNSPTLLKAFYDGGYNGILIDLKNPAR